MASQGPAVDASGLTVRYDSLTALDGVGFELPFGASLAVLGPNGSGKSTLFSAALGLVEPVAGSIAIGAESVAYVPQRLETGREFPATVRDVVRMGRWADLGWLRRLGREDHERVDAALALLDIDAIAERSFAELSGGQRQRALLAQAVAQDARVLLLDEPFTGVDRPTGELLRGLIPRLAAEGRAVLVATHDLESAAEYDLVLCLNARVVAFGPPAETLTEAILRETFSGHVARVGDTVIDTAHHHHGAA